MSCQHEEREFVGQFYCIECELWFISRIDPDGEEATFCSEYCFLKRHGEYC